MQHPTNEDNNEDDEDYESDETMELATDDASNNGSESDEESDDGSVLLPDGSVQLSTNEDDDENYESDETMELAKDEASDDGSAAYEAAELAAELKQRQIDWLEKAIKNISEIAFPIIQNKEWDRLEEIDSFWDPPPGIRAVNWKENNTLYRMIRAWQGWDDEEEEKPPEFPTKEEIAQLLQSFKYIQEIFTQQFTALHKNQNFVLLP